MKIFFLIVFCFSRFVYSAEFNFEKTTVAGFFDYQFYKKNYNFEKDSNDTVLQHFFKEGDAKGYRPNSNFDPRLYHLLFPTPKNSLVDWLTQPSGINNNSDCIKTFWGEKYDLATLWYDIECSLREKKYKKISCFFDKSKVATVPFFFRPFIARGVGFFFIENQNQIIQLKENFERELILNYSSIERPYSANNLIGLELFGLLSKNYEDKWKNIIESGKKQILNTDSQKMLGIEKIFHCLWITSPYNPYEPPLEKIKSFYLNKKKLNDWEWNFWCNDASLIPQTVAYLKKEEPLVKIREIQEIYHSFLGKKLYEHLIKNNFLTYASNIARSNITFHMGGFFGDLSVKILTDLNFYAEHFDHIFIQCSTYGHLFEGFFGVKSYSSLWRMNLLFWENLNKMSLQTLKNLDRMNYAGPGFSSFWHLPAVCAKYRSNQHRILIAPEKSFVVFKKRLSSWIHGTFGNTSSKVRKIDSLFVREAFGVDDEDLKKDEFGLFLTPYHLGRCKLCEVMTSFFYSKNVESTSEKRKEIEIQSKKIYYDSLDKSPFQTIPHITHRVWVTSETNPFEAPEQALEYYVLSCNGLKQKDWIHYFWCMDPSKIPNTIKYLEKNIKNITIKNIASLGDFVGIEYFKKLYDANRYTNASILIRHNVLYQFGGVYSDLGTIFKGNFERCCDLYDHIFAQRNWDQDENWVDVNFMASVKKSHLFGKVLGLINFLKNLKAADMNWTFLQVPRYINYRYDHAWVSGQALTTIVDTFSSTEDKILFASFDSLYKNNNLASWLFVSRFGNKTPFDAPVLFIKN